MNAATSIRASITERSIPSPAVVFPEIQHSLGTQRAKHTASYAMAANILLSSGAYRYTSDDSDVFLGMTFAHRPQKVLNTLLRALRSGNKINIQPLDGLSTSSSPISDQEKRAIFHSHRGALKFQDHLKTLRNLRESSPHSHISFS